MILFLRIVNLYRFAHSGLYLLAISNLECKERPGKPRPRTVQEQPHAQHFSPLNGYEPQMTPNMILILKISQHSFVFGRIPLQPDDALLERLAKARADLIAFEHG